MIYESLDVFAMDDENTEEETKTEQVITLMTEDGREIEFIEVAIVPLGGRVYAILQPVELLEGMEEGEALVFEMMIGEDGPEGFNVVLDDEKIDAVFAVYNEMCDDGMPYENN